MCLTIVTIQLPILARSLSINGQGGAQGPLRASPAYVSTVVGANALANAIFAHSDTES